MFENSPEATTFPSTYYLPEGKNEIVVELAAPHTISGFVYTPNQGRDSQGHISNYQLSVYVPVQMFHQLPVGESGV